MGTRYTKNTYDDYIYAQEQAAAREALRRQLYGQLNSLQVKLNDLLTKLETFTKIKAGVDKAISELTAAEANTENSSTLLTKYYNVDGQPRDNGNFGKLSTSIASEISILTTTSNNCVQKLHETDASITSTKIQIRNIQNQIASAGL